MRKPRQLRIITLTLVLGVFLLAACERSSATVVPVVPTGGTTETASQPTADVAENTLNAYPSSPEEVIEAFLVSYPVDTVYSIQFLSPGLVKDLDVESVSKLLPGTGEIKGFIIESGSTSAEAERSEILASIAFEDRSTQVVFHLEIVDGRWVIEKIN